MKNHRVILLLVGIILALSLQINFSVATAQEQRAASETWNGVKILTEDYSSQTIQGMM